MSGATPECHQEKKGSAVGENVLAEALRVANSLHNHTQCDESDGKKTQSRMFSVDLQIVLPSILLANNRKTDLMTGVGVDHAFPMANDHLTVN